MTNLYLIRHGQATTQVSNIFRDDGLTPLGITQAERLRDRLAASGEIAADVLIASTLPRARQTAEIIAPALKLPIIFDDEVQELRIGEAEGMHVDDFRQKFGDYNIEEYPFKPVAPGGENWGMFLLRVGTALERITREHEGKNIVVVCHGGIVDASFIYFFQLNSLMMPPVRFDTHNTSITHWRKSSPAGRTTKWRIIRYNDNLHVRDIDAEERIPWHALTIPPRRDRSMTPSQPTIPVTEK